MAYLDAMNRVSTGWSITLLLTSPSFAFENAMNYGQKTELYRRFLLLFLTWNLNSWFPGKN